MKIAIICEVLGEPNNGTSLAAYNLINYLKSKGHDVRVVCPDEDKKGQPGYYILSKLKITRFIDYLIARNDVTLSAYDEKIIYDAVHDCDVVHFLVALFISRKASKYVKSLGVPMTAGFHNQAENFSAQIGLINNHLANHLFYKWYDKNLYCRVDAIHYPTQFIKDTFEKNVRRKTNGYVISNGVNAIVKPMKIERPVEMNGKFNILFIGRFSKEKSHITLVKAVERSKYKDKIQLYFAGKGPTLNSIVKYSKKHLTNQPIIKFYKREDLVKLINCCDLYCHPAIAEIEAISCLEAITCGLVPLIANSSRSATKAFALDERCLFKPSSPKDLAKKIEYFIEHPEEKEELSKKYLTESKKFDQQYCMSLMEKMLIEVVEKNKLTKEKKD